MILFITFFIKFYQSNEIECENKDICVILSIIISSCIHQLQQKDNIKYIIRGIRLVREYIFFSTILRGT